MARKLVTVALAGFGVAAVCAVIVTALGGPGRISLRQNFGADLPFDFNIGGGDCPGGDPAQATATRSIPWTSSSGKIELDLFADINSGPGNGDLLTITGPKNAIDRINVSGDEVGSDCTSSGGDRLVVTLPGRAFQRYQMSGLGKLHLTGLNQPELDLDISGAALVDAAGVVPRTNLDVSGAASINLNNLITQDLHASLSGASNLNANPAQSADIDLSGAGLVTLRSRPPVYHAEVSGLGHIDVPDQTTPAE